MNMTKSAPLPERPCEQLTCCTKNKYEQWDYINRVTKRHNCLITGKTKATRYGGPSTQIARYPQRMGIANNATFAAGGQSLSCSVITGTTALSRLGYAQLFFNSISQARRNISPSLLPQRFFFSKHDFKRKAATIKTIAQSAQFLSFGIFYSYGCRRDSSHHGADSNYSDSLALRRWRRLISPRMAVTINCASVSFSSLTKFISLKTSRGILAVFCCDLLLVVPVGITGLLTVRWRSVYVEKKIKKGLKCKSPKSSIIFKGDLHLKNKAPQVSLALAGLLTTNDSESIEVAMLNHTTHPQGRDSHNLNKYIWRFTAQPRVITIEATSEQEARQKNQLIATGGNGYDSRAPHKTGAGITTPLEIKAIQTPHASFFVSAHTHTFTMVGCTGPTSVGLVSFIASCGNSVQSTASELTTSGGGVIPTIKEAANMATIPTLVHSQTAFIWRFIIFGASESQIIHVTAWTEREARNRCPSGCVAVFAARIRQGVRHVQ